MAKRSRPTVRGGCKRVRPAEYRAHVRARVLNGECNKADGTWGRHHADNSMCRDGYAGMAGRNFEGHKA